MYNNGISPKKISKIVDKGESEIFKILREEKVLRKNVDNRDKMVCEMYQQNLKITEIANNLKINRHTVTDILKKYDFYKNIRVDTNDISNLDRNKKVIEQYLNGKSLREIANSENISSSGVSLILKKNNIKLRPQHQKGHGKGTSKNRKYFYNERFFQKIDTEHKAYWLGFLFADGCVCDKGIVTLTLNEKDKYILEDFKKSIEAFDTPLTYNKKSNSYSLNFYSVNMTNDLIRLGCIPNKSLCLMPPNEVPKQLLHHFIRGYFDGDGCISITKKYRPCLSFLGTLEMITWIQNIIDESIGKEKKNKLRHIGTANTYQLAYGGKQQILKIYDFLYNDTTIFLKRKDAKFHEL